MFCYATGRHHHQRRRRRRITGVKVTTEISVHPSITGPAGRSHNRTKCLLTAAANARRKMAVNVPR